MNSTIIIMGVSGVGKTTLGLALSERLGIPFFDADDYHPAENVAKMSAGIPLQDEDRWPWLDRLAQLLAERETQGTIMACSALKASYRTVMAAPLQKPPTWLWLHASPELIAQRMAARSGHFMPASLLQSQFDALEIPTEGVFQVDAALPTAEQVDEILKSRDL